MTTAPIVRTMEPEDAHPLHLEWMVVRGAVLRFAAHLAGEGYERAAEDVRAAVDAITTAGAGIPRHRTEPATKDGPR